MYTCVRIYVYVVSYVCIYVYIQHVIVDMLVMLTHSYYSIPYTIVCTYRCNIHLYTSVQCTLYTVNSVSVQCIQCTR